MKTFELWLIESELDEGFLDSMKQGFQQSYQQTRQQPGQNLEKFGQIALPAIKRATAFAGMLSQKTGVPLPLATALIASGLTGGPAAVPFAALLYFVKKPLMKGASNVFDAGVNAYNSGDFQKGVANFKQGFVNGAARNPINTLPTGSAPKVAQPNAWNAGLARMGRQGSMQPEHLVSFKNYCLYQEGFGDWAGQKIGSFAGKLSGNMVSAGQKVTNLVKQNFQQLTQFASQNKLAIGKAAFLMGVGALVGGGIGKLTHDAIDTIVQNIGDAGVPQAELAWLRKNFGIEGHAVDQHGTHHVSGDQLVGDKQFNTDFDKHVSNNAHADVNSRTTMGPTSISATDWINDNTEVVNGTLDKLKNTFGSVVTVRPLDHVQDGGSNAVLSYTVELKPEPGQSSQAVLQNFYRTLAQELHDKKINILDLKATGTDPSGAIKAMLSVAPNLTAAGASAGAAAGYQQSKRR